MCSEAMTVHPGITCAAGTSTADERILTARLGYTHAKFGIGPFDRSDVGDGLLLSFAYKMFGFSTGLHEGVLLGATGPAPVPRLKEFAGEIGATLLKITRTAPEQAVAGQVQTERLPSWIVVQRAAGARDLLPLKPTYEDTLAAFGRHTRRNIRHVRKMAVEAGLTVETSTGPALISSSDRAALGRQTRPKGIAVSLSRRLEAYVERTGRPFRSVVRAPGGEIVSYTCGYFGEPGSACLLYQLNNPAFNTLSPSLLNRAYLIEWLIERGCAELVFVHGCSSVLQHACLRQPLEELLLVRRTLAGYLAASPFAFAGAESSLGRLVRAAVLPSA